MGEVGKLWEGNYTSAQNNLFAKVDYVEEACPLSPAPSTQPAPGAAPHRLLRRSVCSLGSTVKTELPLLSGASTPSYILFVSDATHAANETSAFQIYPLMLGRCISSLN